ncbi:MAG: NAD(P)H-dependent oxidoreductase [Burkholderiaceae bacterium]
MGKHILLIQGHPDASQKHLCHALQDAYARGAEKTNCEIQCINVATLDFPLLRSQHEWENGLLPASLDDAQKAIKWAEHIVLFFPLWLGDMPALLKGFLEQVARPGFAFAREGRNPLINKELSGKSARVVVTMGMPALMYRWFYRAHSVKSLERNILGFVGIAPISTTLIGMVADMTPETAYKCLSKLEKLGENGE